MNRLNRCFSTAIAANLMLANVAIADQIAEGTTNGYFAEYTVLGPQTGCDAPGMMAYQLDFEASDVPFSVEHALTGQVQAPRARNTISIPEPGGPGTIMPVVVEPEEQCFITHRRGNERIKVEIECTGGRQSSDPFALFEAEGITLSISGQAMVCVSLTEFEVLSGSWTADLESGLEQVSYAGASFVSSLPSCDETQDALPAAKLNHVMRGILGNPAEFGGHRITEDEATAAGFQLSLNGLPLPSNGSIASRYTVKAGAFFFPTFAGEADCPNNICRVPKFRRWGLMPHRLICK